MSAQSVAKLSVLALSLMAGDAGLPAVPANLAVGERYVTVNGRRLTPAQLALADRNAGYQLPHGHYWHDLQSGYWGRVGGGALGRVAPPKVQVGWHARPAATFRQAA